MRQRIAFYLLLLLVSSCKEPAPSTGWVGSRKNQRIFLLRTFPQLSPGDALRVYPDIDEDLVRASWPGTLDEAVTRVMNDMDEADKQLVRATKKRELILFHHGWGTGIRNEFGLWRGNTNLLADCHATNADEASMIIIETLWARLQKQ